MSKYVATLHVLIDADGEGEACDTLSELLRDAKGIDDWGYAETRDSKPAKINLTGPVVIPFNELAEYEEGDFYAMLPKSHKLT